jgi:MaoC like domain
MFVRTRRKDGFKKVQKAVRLPCMVIRPWSVQAVNLPEHADNPIHTDVGAAMAGFPRALVAGVTVYAVLTRPVADAEPEWPRRGAGEVRFRSPVFDGDLIDMVPVESESGLTVEARVAGALRASLTVLTDVQLATAAEGATLEMLEPLSVVLDGTYADYGQRSGDDLALYHDGTVHPSIWLKLANRVFAEQLVNGSWVHTRSRFVHHDSARVGSMVTVSGVVVRRFSSSAGERAVALLTIESPDGLIARIEHEAIVAMAGDSPMG